MNTYVLFFEYELPKSVTSAVVVYRENEVYKITYYKYIEVCKILIHNAVCIALGLYI